MAASVLSAVLTSTLSFTSKNPSSETGKRKNGFRSSCNAYCNLTIARYQDRLSAFRMPPRRSFYTNLGHDRTLARRWRIHIFLPHLIASMEELEETYVMVKPDGLQRGLVGEIISRFEKKGFLLKGLKLFHCSRELAEDHYEELKDKSFYPKLVDYITSGPVVCMAWEGIGVVASARKIIGATNPLEADPGTIRGDFAIQTGRNVIHGSDSPLNGSREVALWFNKDELYEWVPAQLPCLKK